MTKSKKNSDVDGIIASQWGRNSQYRFKELNSGQDKTYANILCPVLHELLENHSSGRVVLDAGCGLGFFSAYIHKRGFNVTGIDISSECVSIARKKFPFLSLSTKGIVEFTESKREFFDACVANMLFHNVPNIKNMAEAFFQTLKPGGVLIGCFPDPELWFGRKCQSAKRITVCGKKAYLAPFKIKGADIHPSPFIYFHRQLTDYLQVLQQAGFASVHAISCETISWLPDDLVFFVAKKQ